MLYHLSLKGRKMPERQEGINSQRADELERLLERQFEIAGLGKPGGCQGQSAIEIIDTCLMMEYQHALSTVLDNYLHDRAVDSQLSIQIALICGELFGAGNLSDIESRVERSEATQNRGITVS